MTVEELERRQRLGLRRRGEPALHGEVAEKDHHVALAKLTGVAEPVMPDEPPRPLHVRLLRATAEVPETELRAERSQQ
jgi:hypothetical protein